MSLILHRLIRCRVVVGAPFGSTPLMDALTGASIETIRGNATRMEFGFFDPAGGVLDLSTVQSLNLKLQPSQTESGPLADQTLAAADLDVALNAATWSDGTKAHATFHFPNAEMNLASLGTKRGLWLVITAILTNGAQVTLCGGTLTLHEDNNDSIGDPPANPGTALTLEQGDLRYAMAGGGGSAATITIGTVTSGETAAVENVGTTTDAVFNFTLPRGEAGPAGTGKTWINITLTAYLALTAPEREDADIVYNVDPSA